MKLTREAIQRMISQKPGTSNVTVINQGGGGGGVTLGPLLTSLNSEAMPTSEGYLHWTGSAWAFDTPTGGDPVDLTPYALKTWVQDNFALTSALAGYVTIGTAQTITGQKTFADLLKVNSNIEIGSGNAYKVTRNGSTIDILAYKATAGHGVSGEHWFVGNSVPGVIQSSDPLRRYTGGTAYTIWDSGNLDPSAYLLQTDIASWAKAASKPAYTLDEVADGLATAVSGNEHRILYPAGSVGWFYNADEYHFDSDLFVNSQKVATQSWVNTQLGGYLPLTGGTMEPDATITLQETVSGRPVQSLVASRRWVNAQGFLTSADLSAYATQSWVNTQLANYQGKIHFLNSNNNDEELEFSYLTLPLSYGGAGRASLDLSAYATKEWVGQQGYVNQQWVYNRGFAYNADLLDLYNYVGSTFVQTLGVSGDYVTWTKADTTNQLTVPFATRSSQLNGRLGREYAMIGRLASNIDSNRDLDSFLQAGTYTCQTGSIAGTLSNTPYTAGNFRLWHIVNTGEDSGTGQWSAQLLLAPNSPRLYLRGHVSTGFTAWHEIAFRDDLKFYNTKNGSVRVDTVNNIYLPLTVGTGSGTGNVSLDLSDYATTSALNTALAGYLPLTGGTVESLTVTNGLDADSITVGSLVNSDTLAEYLDADAMQTWGDGRYLKLTGGTLTGRLVAGSGVYFGTNGNQGGVYYDNGLVVGCNAVRILSDGVFTFNGSQVATVSSLSGYLPLAGGAMTGNISFKGTKATYDMITFLDNVSDTYGNGIAIGGGGTTIIGGGASAATIAAQISNGGGKLMYIGNDGAVSVFTNLQDGWGYHKEFYFGADGSFWLPQGENSRQMILHPSGKVQIRAATGGWAFSLGAYNNAGSTSLGQFGSYGYNDILIYMYIGRAYNDTWMVVNPSGNVGIGTTAPTVKLDVTGNVKAYGATLVAAEAGRAALLVDGTTTTNNLTVGTTANGGTTILNGNVTIGRAGVAETIIINGYDVQFNARDIYINNGSTNVKLARVSLLSSYMPLAGGTFTGSITVNGNVNAGHTVVDGQLNVYDSAFIQADVMVGDSIYFGSDYTAPRLYVDNGHLYFNGTRIA